MATLRLEIRTYSVKREVPCVLCGKFFEQRFVAVVLLDGLEQLGEICPPCLAGGPKQRAERVREHVARMRSQARQMQQEAAGTGTWTAQARQRAAQLGSRATALVPLADRIEKGRLADLRVLVIDGNKDAADSLASRVRGWGHDAQVVYDGASALAVACAYQPHVLLLDLGIPQVDGFQLARQLRQQPGLREAIIVAVTGQADPALRERGKEAGCDHSLVKPVAAGQLEPLLKMVRSVKHLGTVSDTIKAGDTVKIGKEPTPPPEERPPLPPGHHPG
jgi:CheY-like chemotaxis protein